MRRDRRRHYLFTTRNTEYHLRSDECVGVRDLDTGSWIRNHAALRLRAFGLLRTSRPHVALGQRLQFNDVGTKLVTSPVVAVSRPPIHCIDYYVSSVRSGEIYVPPAWDTLFAGLAHRACDVTVVE